MINGDPVNITSGLLALPQFRALTGLWLNYNITKAHLNTKRHLEDALARRRSKLA